MHASLDILTPNIGQWQSSLRQSPPITSTMKSELDIPMPEIPGYLPPNPSEKPKSRSASSPGSATPQGGIACDEFLRHRASHANLYQFPSWQQNTYAVNMMAQAPAPQAFPNIGMFGNMQVQQPSQVPLNPPSRPPVVPASAPSLPQNFPLQHPFQPQLAFPPPLNPPPGNNQHTLIQAPPPPQKQMYPGNIDLIRPAHMGRNWIDAQWLQPEVPKDSGFGLIGETLLCPLKVAILILQDIFRRNR